MQGHSRRQYEEVGRFCRPGELRSAEVSQTFFSFPFSIVLRACMQGGYWEAKTEGRGYPSSPDIY